MKLRALAMVVIAVALTVFTSSQTFATTTVPTTAKALPAVDLLATPAGWVPVVFGNAQISVPADLVGALQLAPCPTGSPPGEVFVNPPPGVFHCPMETAPGPSTTVSFGPPTSPLSTVLGHPEVINGILVYPYPTGPQSSYLVPSLGVEITVDGPLGQRVLHTLTWSPRSVVLAPGSSPAVPSSWQQVTFAGLRFSVPANWPIYQTQLTPGLGAICATSVWSLSSTTVTLSTDVRPMHYPCASFHRMLSRENGIQVDLGLRTEPMVTLSFSAHCLVLHGLTSCPATSPAYSILVVRVNVPGRSSPSSSPSVGRQRHDRQDHPGFVATGVSNPDNPQAHRHRDRGCRSLRGSSSGDSPCEGEGEPLLRVKARCLGDGGLGYQVPVLSQSWDVPPDGLVGFQGCDSTGRSHRHCQLLEPLHLGRATVRGTIMCGLRGNMTTVKFRALVPVVMTLMLAVCTSTRTVAPTTTKGTGVVTGTANLSFLERQELAAANTAWAGVGGSSPPSLVAPTVQLSGAGFVSGDAKIAFGFGRVKPPFRFPSSPAREGRWVIISARQAFHFLATPTPPAQGMYAGPSDKVLRVHLGTDIWETADGTMRFPAWLFTVSGLNGTASVLALSPSDLFQPLMSPSLDLDGTCQLARRFSGMGVAP